VQSVQSTVAGPGAARRVWQAQLTFHAGRVVGFAALGGLLGMVGSRVPMPPVATLALTLAATLAMLLLGLRLTEISPRLAAWSPQLPAGLGERFGILGPSESRARAGVAVAGAATFFLPCGFTQTVQLYALSTGSGATAASVMAVFALGTVPGLLGLAGMSTLGGGRHNTTVLRVLGTVVLGFALITGSAATRVANVDFSWPGSRESANLTASAIGPELSLGSGDQTLRITQDEDGYHPSTTVVYADRPTHLLIDSRSQFTCAAAIWSSDLGFEALLGSGDNLIEVPALKEGTYTYSCTMGMYGGQITVIGSS
jgi:sulfite exporter TauE/SafE